MNKTLFSKLSEYAEGNTYPYHMPGHKRQGMGELPESISKLDITEIDGFDNLHYPEEILKVAQDNAASLYGALKSFFLINGSTVGVLAAVSASLPRKGKILIARNCHKSVYHAIFLRELRPVYLYPKTNAEFDICEPITAGQVEEALEKNPDIQAVLIVSPTYEGRIADVKKIAEVVHQKKIPLIVDEAHGAHLGFHPAFAENSIRQGADLCIQSLHKTLPSLTQTAILHFNSQLVSEENVKKFLRIYQSSSPSYILMASMDSCIRFMKEKGKESLDLFYSRWEELLRELKVCKSLSFLIEGEGREEIIRQDPGKLVISVKGTGISGVELYNMLLTEYHLQMEMVCDTYVLAMLTIGDPKEGFDRLKDALLEIDQKLSDKKYEKVSEKTPELESIEWSKESEDIKALPLYLAYEEAKRPILLEKAGGCYSAEFVSVYPPGTPILVPGEMITEQIREQISYYLRRGLNVQGITKLENTYYINVVEVNR